MRGFTLRRLLLFHKRSCEGFTLIELMVVMVIMAILMIVAVPGYKGYSNNQKVYEAANQLQATLRQAQVNAQTGTVCNLTGGITKKALFWYVGLALNDNNKYYLAPRCDDSNEQQAPTLTQLPTGVTISAILIHKVNDCSITGNYPVEVQFANVTSNISFNDLNRQCSDDVNAYMEISLQLTGSSTPSIVRIEKGGGIYVKQ